MHANRPEMQCKLNKVNLVVILISLYGIINVYFHLNASSYHFHIHPLEILFHVNIKRLKSIVIVRFQI